MTDPLPPEYAAVLSALSDAQVVAGTAWAEARARLEGGTWRTNPPEAMHDIADVIDRRVHDRRWSRLGYRGVCLQPFAFSCWLPRAGADNDRDPQHLADNFQALMDRMRRLLAGETPSATLLTCLAIAEVVTGRGAPDPTSPVAGATHYYAKWLAAPPRWSLPPSVLVAERFGQRFFRNVR